MRCLTSSVAGLARTVIALDRTSSFTSVNCLLLTARKAYTMHEQGYNLIMPQSLSSDRLMFFIINYLEIKYRQILTDSDSVPLSNFREQLKFAEKFGDIFEHIPTVLPLLVKLVIDKYFIDYYEAVIRDFEKLMDKMPRSVAEIYIDYLRMVNPVNANAQNFLNLEQMFEVAKLLGFHSIRDTFRPHDFPLKDFRQALQSDLPLLNAIDPIQRFIDNQVITLKQELAAFNLRFNLDPCAEFLGAFYLIERMTPKETVLYYQQSIQTLGTDASGFKFAFEEICRFKTISL